MPVFEMQFLSLFIMIRGGIYKAFVTERKLNIQVPLPFHSKRLLTALQRKQNVYLQETSSIFLHQAFD